MAEPVRNILDHAFYLMSLCFFLSRLAYWSLTEFCVYNNNNILLMYVCTPPYGRNCFAVFSSGCPDFFLTHQAGWSAKFCDLYSEDVNFKLRLSDQTSDPRFSGSEASSGVLSHYRTGILFPHRITFRPICPSMDVHQPTPNKNAFYKTSFNNKLWMFPYSWTVTL
jgi:hypothetical protein